MYESKTQLYCHVYHIQLYVFGEVNYTQYTVYQMETDICVCARARVCDLTVKSYTLCTSHVMCA